MARMTIASLIVIGAALSASAADARHRNSPQENYGLYSYNQPVVQRTDYVLELASQGPGLSLSERARLRTWFTSLGIGYGDRVSVESPYDGPVRADVARVPGCPFADEHQGLSATSRNYGCSVNSNLAAMIADPNDLVLGQAGSAASDPATSAKAIKTYREAKPTGASGLTSASSRSSN